MPRPFFVEPYHECPRYPDDERRLPPHRLVIEPLLRAASAVHVFQKRGMEFKVPVPPHTVRRGRLALDTSQELVKGWEPFWNSGTWARGAVCIELDVKKVDWPELFSWTQFGGEWSSRHQIKKGTPSGAVAYADKTAKGDVAVASLPASNGIQWVDLWFDETQASSMQEVAAANCRSFVRWIEHNKFPREIIIDRPPYSELV